MDERHGEHHVHVSIRQAAGSSTLDTVLCVFRVSAARFPHFTHHAVAFDCQPGARAVRGSWLNAQPPLPLLPLVLAKEGEEKMGERKEERESRGWAEIIPWHHPTSLSPEPPGQYGVGRAVQEHQYMDPGRGSRRHTDLCHLEIATGGTPMGLNAPERDHWLVQSRGAGRSNLVRG